MAKMK
jgi:hypothetical protein